MSTVLPQGQLNQTIESEIDLNGEKIKISLHWVENMYSPFMYIRIQYGDLSRVDMPASRQEPAAWRVQEALVGTLSNFCYGLANFGDLTIKKLGDVVKDVIIANTSAFSKK
jgi:hypothetical protein